MCEINIKKSILEVVKDNNLEILKIDLVNSDEAWAIMKIEICFPAKSILL